MTRTWQTCGCARLVSGGAGGGLVGACRDDDDERPLGFVFQTFNLLATMSAFENVELPMMLLGKLNATERKEKALMLLTCTYPSVRPRERARGRMMTD